MRHRILYNRDSKEVFFCADNSAVTNPPINISVSCVVTDNILSAELLLRKRGYNVDVLHQYYLELTGEELQLIDSLIPTEIMQAIEQLCAMPFDPEAQLYYAAWFPGTKTCAIPIHSEISVITDKEEQFAFEDEIGVELIKLGLQLEGYDVSNINL